jgi:hypothetical protein
MGASPPAAGTGLSACIFFACGKKGYRFYPLRVLRRISGRGASVMRLSMDAWGAPTKPCTAWFCPLRVHKSRIFTIDIGLYYKYENGYFFTESNFT